MNTPKTDSFKQGMMAALIASAAVIALPAFATEGESGDRQKSRETYMNTMEERIDAAQRELDSKEDNTENDLQLAWNEVEQEWEALSAAADENWEDAKASMDEAWEDFQKEWDETFSEEPQPAE
ncbi:MAG: hypothetical protein WDZ84_13985 [Rhodovibrionaceae bacterium]